MRRGFTLIELLVVVAIIALLIAILLPSLAQAKAQGRVVVCESNMRQVALGFIYYAHENNEQLPGSTWDYIGPRVGPTYNNSTPLCWLGSLDGGGNIANMPTKGTIFKYVINPKVYKCPDDKMERRVYLPGGGFLDKPEYSYTSPPLLTGAPIPLLKATRWPQSFTQPWISNNHWARAMEVSMPWLLVEEDSVEYLADVTDSAWSNTDLVSDRHRGRGVIAHIDGSANPRAFQRKPFKMNAWCVYYELQNGKIISAGTWGRTTDIRTSVEYGYLRRARQLVVR